MKDCRDLLGILSDAPGRIIDQAFARRLDDIARGDRVPTADDLIDLLDDAVFGSLCGGFIIVALDAIWRELGGTKEQAEARRALR